jgi:hypothetical protein
MCVATRRGCKVAAIPRPVTTLHAQRLDIRAGGLGHPQAVERQQRDQRVLGRLAEPGGSWHVVAVSLSGRR